MNALVDAAEFREVPDVTTANQDAETVRIREVLARGRFDHAIKPPQLRVVFSLADIPICTPGNLTAITAQAKTGKSAVIGAAMASVIAEQLDAVDTLKLSSRNEVHRAVVHFDTEQSPDDHWNLVNRAMRRARLNAPPPWLQSYRLAGQSGPDAWSAVKLGIADAAGAHGGIHSVFIDGVADLVRDVNDAEECNAFVAELQNLAIVHDCPIITAIHFNPGGEKVRGHLGSQLERKCETNLSLEKDGAVTVIWSHKQRGAPIFKDAGPRFRWSEEAGMHVSCSADDSPTQSAKLETLRLQRDEVFRERKAMRYGDAIATAIAVLRYKERTAETKFAEWRKRGLVEKNVAGLWIPKS